MARSARAAFGAALILALAAPGASAAKLLVDDDGLQCPNRDATSLAAAVATANADPAPDTIYVCAGLYRHGVPVEVTEPLDIVGTGADFVRIEPSADFAGHVIEASGDGRLFIQGVTIAAGDAPDRPPAAVGGALSIKDAGGSLLRSRITDLAGANGVSFDTAVGLTALQIDESLIEGYGEYGVRAATSGPAFELSLDHSIVRGRGPFTGSATIQDGVRVVGANAVAHVTRSSITDNRNTTDERMAAGVRFEAASDASTVTENDLQGNSYGVFRGDATGVCDNGAGTLDAEHNWWGHSGGATSEPLTLCLPVAGPPSAGSRVNTGVDAEPPATEPHGTPTAPGLQRDAEPDLAITSPTDGTEADPGTPVTVVAAASDDFDIARVEFYRFTALEKTDTTPPYDVSIPAPAAGESLPVTAVAIDSSGHRVSDAIRIRGKSPQEPQQPQQPQQPSEPEDRPPSVAITGPGEGTAISPSAPPRITADAGDDRGVARVAFLDDGKVICTDDVAPYDCAYAPTGDDVGRDTLIAIAVDGAGQTAVAFRGVTVQRFDPKLTARTTPKRDRKRPYRYTTTGSVLLPSGVSPEQACATGGSVAIEFRVGKLRLPQTAALRPDCSFRTSIAFPSKRSLGNGRIAVSAKFGGNVVLGTAKAPSQKVRAG